MTPAGVDAETVLRRLRLRNVLVHHYAEVRLDLVADAVVEVLDGFPAYVAAVARCLKDRGIAT